MKKILTICSICLFSNVTLFNYATAEDLIGVNIEEVLTVSVGGEELRLRGAALKSSPRQAIYVGGLYLKDDSSDVEAILASDQAKRFVLYCQDSKVKPDALIRALNLGINANHSEQELVTLAPMIKQFNALWNSQIKQGDKVWVDYFPGEGTIVSINGVQKGLIPGKLFYSAFLKTWLGDSPLNESMKQQLLGNG